MPNVFKIISNIKQLCFVLCFVLLISFLSFTVLSSTVQANSGSETEVLILQIIEHPALNATREGIEDELKTAGFSYHYESAQGNPALASQIAQKFLGDYHKVMVGIGTAASQALAAEDRGHQTPIVFSSVTDPLKAKLLTNFKQPEGSITGVSNYVAVSKPLGFFKKFLPKLSKLGIIYNPGEINSIHLVEEAKREANSKGIQIITAVANNSAEVASATRRLVNEVDAIFINNDNTALSAFESITKIAGQHQVPVFVSDTDLIKKGALAAFGPNQYLLGRQTGKMIVKILKGEKISNIPVEFPEKIEILVNRQALERLNLSIPSEMEKQILVVDEK